VRLEAASHSSEVWRPVEERDQASVMRLEAWLASGTRRRRVLELRRSAKEHVAEAFAAYLEVRGLGTSPLAGVTKPAKEER